MVGRLLDDNAAELFALTPQGRIAVQAHAKLG
jgi:hypothetical protein